MIEYLKKHWLPISILSSTLVAAVLRFVLLDNIPGILNRDEAALAYNALLLLETGRDEWQQQWPLLLKSFGDFKLAGYSYITMLLFSFLPEADWVVRLPSAIAGILLVPISFLLSKELLAEKWQAAVVSALVAITPVFIFYSRMAYEANVGLSLFAVVVFLLLKQTDSKRLLLDTIALLLLAISTVIYNTPLLLAPFLIPLIVLRRGWKHWKVWLFPTLGIFSISFLSTWLLSSAIAQKSGITIFDNPDIYHYYIEYRNALPDALLPLLGNRYAHYVTIVVPNFINSFLPNFMVFEGGQHPWHGLPQWGHVYFSVYLLGIVGLLRSLWKLLIRLWNERVIDHLHFSLMYLLVIGLAPAVVTVDAPHATRSLWFFLMWLLVAASGLQVITEYFRNKGKWILFVALSVLLWISTIHYSHDYILQYPEEYPTELQVGLDESVQKIQSSYPDANVAVVDPNGYAYILIAWYQRISPDYFWGTMKWKPADTARLRKGEQVGQYTFILEPDETLDQYDVLLQQESNTSWVIQEL